MTTDKPLKSPVELTEADVVIYDGNCKFCKAQVRRLESWDGQNRLSFISLHDSFVSENYTSLEHDALMKQMYVVDHKTQTPRGGAKALRYLSRRLPKLWFAMPFLHIPFTLWIWQWLYLQIAKRRYKISNEIDSECTDDACKIHLS